jgi:formylmethanofuran dehydrogenase subunit B
MSDERNNSHRFTSIQSGLTVISTLEERVDDDNYYPQLNQARTYVAEASRHVGTAGFNRIFSKAMGYASSVAVANGHDDLAEDALELGGDEDER